MLVGVLWSVTAAFLPWLWPGTIEARAFYHPGDRTTPTPSDFEDVRFPTSDGLELHGWFMPARGLADSQICAPTVLHVHGNTHDIGAHRNVCQHLRDHGWNVMMFDYRGFGRSDEPGGLLGREVLVEDTSAAIDYLLTRGDVDSDRLVVFGYSLGAVLGLAASAEREEVDAVVAFAGFATWEGVAADKAGWLGRALISSGYDAVDSVVGLGDRPLLIVHGTRDRLVGYDHAEKIRDAAATAGVPVEFLPVEGGTHISLGGDGRVRAAVVEFIGRSVSRPQE